MGAILNKPKISTQDQAILDLKIQRDKLQQYQKRIQIVLEKETEFCKTALKNQQKQRALLALKKKKYQEKLLNQTDQQLLQIEQLVQAIEFKLVEKQVLDGLRNGNSILKKLNEEMKLENVDLLMEETQEAIQYQKDIEQAMSMEFEGVEEAEIEKELDALLEMPSVPTTKLPQKEETEEEIEEEEPQEVLKEGKKVQPTKSEPLPAS